MNRTTEFLLLNTLEIIFRKSVISNTFGHMLLFDILLPHPSSSFFYHSLDFYLHKRIEKLSVWNDGLKMDEGVKIPQRKYYQMCRKLTIKTQFMEKKRFVPLFALSRLDLNIHNQKKWLEIPSNEENILLGISNFY